MSDSAFTYLCEKELIDAWFEIHIFQSEKLMNLQKLFSPGFSVSSRKLFTAGLLIFMTVFATACSHDFMLRKPDGTVIGPGVIDFSQGNSAGTLMLEISGAIYRGSWESHKVDENRSIAAEYGLNSRKYQAYSLGNGNYLRQGHATLHSERGGVLKCEFIYRGTSGRGKCESGSDEFDFIIAESNRAIKDGIQLN